MKKHETSRLASRPAIVNEETSLQTPELLIAFMDNVPAFGWIKDLQGRLIYLNKKMKRLPEYQGEWLGKTDFAFWPSEFASQYRANDRKVIELRKTVRTVEPYLFKGKRRYGLVNKFPILDQSGELVLVGGIGIELAVQKNVWPELKPAQPGPRLSKSMIENLQRLTDERTWLTELTSRQREILQLIATSRSTKEIAYALALSPKTVEAHRAQLMSRLGIHDIPALVRYAIRTGLVSPND